MEYEEVKKSAVLKLRIIKVMNGYIYVHNKKRTSLAQVKDRYNLINILREMGKEIKYQCESYWRKCTG